MTVDVVYNQPAFILRQRKYRETSVIVDVLTRDYGRFSLLARGVRKNKSKTAALLQAFMPLTLSYRGNGELKLLTDVASLQIVFQLKGLALYCGFYVSELILCFLHPYDPHLAVFDDYQTCLSRLADHATTLEIESALRIFEMSLIEKIGYGLQLKHDFITQLPVFSDKKYAFDIEYGPYEDVQGYLSGTTLHALSSHTLDDPRTLSEAKALMRSVIDFYLQGRSLKSRQVINQIIKRTSDE